VLKRLPNLPDLLDRPCRVVLVRYEGERGTHCQVIVSLAGANRLPGAEQPAAVVAPETAR